MYYQLFADDYEIKSKVAFDQEEPSIGRIRADSIAPPHSPTSIKRCISRVEGRPALLHANLFADTSCGTPLTERHISILRADGPGLNPDEPMAIVQADVQVEISLPVEVTSIPDGKYLIKNLSPDSDIYWSEFKDCKPQVVFWQTVIQTAEQYTFMLVSELSPIILMFRG